MKFTGEQLLDMRNCLIYILYRDGLVYYVGVSAQGFNRVLNRTHHVLRHMLPTDEVEVEFFGLDLNAALAREVELIEKLDPVMNQKAGGGRGNRAGGWLCGFKPKRRKALPVIDYTPEPDDPNAEFVEVDAND